MIKDLENSLPLNELPQGEKVNPQLNQNHATTAVNERQQIQVYTLDSAYAKIGGFGRLQKLALVCLTLMRNSGMYFFYSFGFLTLDQTYLCRFSSDQQYLDCSAEQICQANESGTYLDWTTNKNDFNFLENWVQQMGLMCVSRVTIQWMAFVYYIAYGVSGFFMWPIPDKMGRRFTFGVFAFLHVACQWTLLLSPNYWVRLLSFLGFGVFQLKVSICYTWMFELSQTQHKSLAISVMNGFDQMSMGVVCSYFIFVSREWQYIFIVVTILATLSYIVAICAIPESPKWLIFSGKESQAIESLNYIAWLNGSEFRFPNDDSVKFLEGLAFEQSQTQETDDSNSVLEQQVNHQAEIKRNNKKDSFVSADADKVSYKQAISTITRQAFSGRVEVQTKHKKALGDQSTLSQILNDTEEEFQNVDKQSYSLLWLTLNLMIIFIVASSLSFMSYYQVTAAGGDIFINGIVLGVAEIASCATSGFLLKYFKDKYVSMLLMFVAALFSFLFTISNPEEGGLLISVYMFLQIVGVGGALNMNYFLCEARAPNDVQGSMMTVLIAASIITASQSAQISYFAYPTPLYVFLGFAFIGIFANLSLPDPINTKQDKTTAPDAVDNQKQVLNVTFPLSKQDSILLNQTLMQHTLYQEQVAPQMNQSLFFPSERLGVQYFGQTRNFNKHESLIMNRKMSLKNDSTSLLLRNNSNQNQIEMPQAIRKHFNFRKDKTKEIVSKWGLKN